MKLITAIADLRQTLAGARAAGKSIGFVPTMGCLHEGHQSLIRQASLENDLAVVSIFVNPLQFGPEEDYATYPRDLDRDCQLAVAAGAGIVFAPAAAEMYPQAALAYAAVELLGDGLCGKSRPGHFRGVCTVVSKLLHIVQPERAYFGEKDAQQLAIIRRLVLDLNMPVLIVAVPIQREPDGLAMSSRNRYLAADERKRAVVLYRALQEAQRVFAAGERESRMLKERMAAMITAVPGAAIDYIEIAEPQTLQPLENIQDTALLALAVRFGKTRLIDNCLLTEGK
ncbi:MAG: pantoate--beta-alanine ligase [Peptococcaceae bacterium]|nr:pantoate--beta-alanine ligase [Peptococcaceae bacterium]